MKEMDIERRGILMVGFGGCILEGETEKRKGLDSGSAAKREREEGEVRESGMDQQRKREGWDRAFNLIGATNR